MPSRSLGSSESDRAFVTRILADDPNVFTDIVHTYSRQVYLLAYDLCRDHDDAEDIVQDVFIRVYKALGKFRGDSKLSTWLYRITVNTFINRTRSLQYEVSKAGRQYDDELATDTGSYSLSDPESVLTQKVIDEHLQSALQELSESQRAVFILRHYHDLPLKEIAEHLGNSEGTVKVLLFRAVHNLQKKLEFYKRDG